MSTWSNVFSCVVCLFSNGVRLFYLSLLYTVWLNSIKGNFFVIFWWANYYSLSPFDRAIGNGFRLSKNLTNTQSNLDNKVIPEFQRNFDDLSQAIFLYSLLLMMATECASNRLWQSTFTNKKLTLQRTIGSEITMWNFWRKFSSPCKEFSDVASARYL